MKKTITSLLMAVVAFGLSNNVANAQTGYPYFPETEVADDITTVATVVENPASALVDLSGNFTVEVNGIAANEIKISNGSIFYTHIPTSNSEVRFVKKNSKVYVYEGIAYKGTVSSQATTDVGITGGTGNVYYVAAVYAPSVILDFAAGDYYDMISLIANPSFEVGTLDGWTNSGMAKQTNVPGQVWIKDGNVYAEKWVNSSGNLPVASISQVVLGLPNGVYKVKASGHAIKQGATDPNATTGAYLFAGTEKTLVNAGGDYEVANVLVIDNKVSIGFKLEGTITCNWAAVDNFRLTYHGVDLTALNNLLAEKVVAAQAILDATDTPNGYNKTELQTAITNAGTVEQTEEALIGAINALNTAISNYDKIVVANVVLKEALDFAATLDKTNYPGKAAFEVAVDNAQGFYDSKDDKTVQNFTDATTTLRLATQSYILPTPVIANLGFEALPVTYTQNNGTANGSLVVGTLGYDIPGWDEVYSGAYARVATTNYGITFSTIPDVLNGTTPPAVDKGGVASGAALKMSGSWGSTTVLTQNVTLPAGVYTLSFEVINKTPGQGIQTNRFGFVPNQGDAIYGTKTVFADTWTTESVTFTLAAETAGKISIGLVGKNAGAASNGKLYIDNVRLDYVSNVATLSELRVAENPIVGFDAATVSYDVVLAAGTTDVPSVTAVATDVNATAVVTNATSLPGTTTVEVTAEDGTTKLTYSINFTVVVPTGVSPSKTIAIDVYPTISKGSFNVDTKGKFSTITVLDITGKMVSVQSGDDVQAIQIAKQGVYLVKVECQGVTKLVKVVKTN